MFPALIDAGWQSEAVGFTTAKGSDMIGALEKLTAWIMEVSLGAVGNDLSRHEIWPSNRICLHGHVLQIHVVFLLRAASRGASVCTAFARRFQERQSTALLNVRSLFCMPSKMPQKRTRYALRKLAAAAKVLKKCVMFRSWQMHCLAWWQRAWQHVWLAGSSTGLVCFYSVAKSCVHSFAIPLSRGTVVRTASKANYAQRTNIQQDRISAVERQALVGEVIGRSVCGSIKWNSFSAWHRYHGSEGGYVFLTQHATCHRHNICATWPVCLKWFH